MFHRLQAQASAQDQLYKPMRLRLKDAMIIHCRLAANYPIQSMGWAIDYEAVKRNALRD